ncbi:MAG TPA: aminopeptidase [Anaerolineales bacterium]|nr:aminopeptidase [Anaerolineales bacterium]
MDPRISKLAQILVHYSLELKPDQQFAIRSTPLAEELVLAVYQEAIQAGAHVFLRLDLPGAEEIFYKHASDKQLDYISPVRKLIAENFDATLYIGAEYNTRSLSNINPDRLARVHKAAAPLSKLIDERAARDELHWCYTIFPTQARAMEAEMDLVEYQDFVYAAGLLNQPDPVALWQEQGQRQDKLVSWLAGRDQVHIQGADIDLSLSIKGRTFVSAAGKVNFPDGELFTGPVETSANGWVRYHYPAIYAGREVIDIELWFEDGKVIKEKASKGQDFLTSLLDTDAGSRYLGEWGIGTNYAIQRFTKNMLFDEKIGGTIHFAVGSGYPETGSQNDSGLHWDMLCDMAESEVIIDGDLFYKDGKPVI